MKKKLGFTIIIEIKRNTTPPNQKTEKIFIPFIRFIVILILVPFSFSVIVPYANGTNPICPITHRWSLNESSEISPRKNLLNTFSENTAFNIGISSCVLSLRICIISYLDFKLSIINFISPPKAPQCGRPHNNWLYRRQLEGLSATNLCYAFIYSMKIYFV